MDYLRVQLEALMLEVMRSCSFVQNDETSILVRSRKSKEDNFKYNTEYIHDALSLEKKLVLIQQINALFLIEREAKARNYTPERRHRFRLDYSALESIFRHILKTRYAHISEQVRAAMGRRCWLNSGSHDAAQNIAFMYSLYESCKMNDIDFGEYVEDILTRMMNGDDDYRSMIPCYYTPGKKQEKKVA